MAFVTYPLDDIDFSAEDAELFHCTRTSGIYAQEDFSISVTGVDNTVRIGAGVGWIRNTRFKGKVIAQKEETQIDMGLPDASYPRYDVVAIRFTANSNGTAVVVKKGTPASYPALPAITQTEAVYELYLYSIRREVGATSITAKAITDLRLDPDYCGLMGDSVTRIDTTAINAQIMELIEQLHEEIAAVKAGTAYVMKSGDIMTGNLTVPTPEQSGHAVNKQYVDTKNVAATLTASGWTGSSAPYTQSITVAGLTDVKTAHIYPDYPGDQELDLAMEEACACVSYARRSGSTVTFTCLQEKPAANIAIRVEVGV